MRRAALVAALWLGFGCTVPIARLDELALEPAAAGRASGSEPGEGVVYGRDCRWWVLGLPLGLPRIDTAARLALAAGGGRVLRDVVVTSEHPAYGPVGRHCYGVRGRAVP